MSVLVERAGFLSSVQDLGRTGFRQFGVSPGGALDLFALRIANLLAGNDDDAAGLEITLGGLQLRFENDRLVAWCGGDFDVRLGSKVIPPGHTAYVGAGEQLKFGHPKTGCRCWLAISDGVDVPITLESRSTDLRAGFGGWHGRVLRDGDVVPLRKARELLALESGISSWTAPHEWVSPAKVEPVLRIVRGVDWHRFGASALHFLTSKAFTVLPDSDRMGVRLDGPELRRINEGDLISEAVVAGTIQVPPSGKPILLLGDCQTIGGYPKIAHVITVDLGVAAQLRAGDHVRFAEVSLADAHALIVERERQLELFRVGVSLHNS
ncbi:MAG TPA: biotin-dependent carboxyltransferase family protein [Candidatus Udaeobacter sp.]|nr:biotin-dependent carboxyltransferase family protein [Candidatus Udaeobacter sp.]